MGLHHEVLCYHPRPCYICCRLRPCLQQHGRLRPQGFRRRFAWSPRTRWILRPPWIRREGHRCHPQRYREAELAHGRVSMLAVIGFLVGEKVEGSSFLFDAQISGPAITHITQVPDGFWAVIIAFIGAYEASRAEAGWVDPADCPVDQPGLLRDDYIPGDLKFDPLGLMPEDPEEFFIMQTKELQNGRLAMLAAAGFLAQEAVDGKGIIEHFQS